MTKILLFDNLDFEFWAVGLLVAVFVGLIACYMSNGLLK